MKKEFLLLTLTAFLVAACKSKKEQVEVQVTATPSTQDLLMTHAIHRDSANTLIKSYLQSIAGRTEPSLKYLAFDADQLRFYLNDSTRGKIATLKIMFAHKRDWIDSGHFGEHANTKVGALTVVLAGFDVAGDYIYIGQNENYVLDFAIGCPSECQTVGSAALDTLN